MKINPKNWFKEYKPYNFNINLNIIFGAIIIKIYVVLTMLAMIVLYNNGNMELLEAETLILYAQMFLYITLGEIIAIILSIIQPIIYNLIVWLKKKFGKKEEQAFY